MQEKRNKQTTGTKTIKKIGKTTYEVIVHFNDKSSKTMQNKLKNRFILEVHRGNCTRVKFSVKTAFYVFAHYDNPDYL